MKHITNFIKEALKINKNSKVLKFINKIDMNELESFTRDDVNKIINWINNDMPDDIIPTVVTNVRKNIDFYIPALEIYLLYTEDYEKYGPYDLPYIRFFYDSDGLSVDIYDHKNTKYYRSEKFKDSSDLDKCFEFIESKRDIIKKLII